MTRVQTGSLGVIRVGGVERVAFRDVSSWTWAHKAPIGAGDATTTLFDHKGEVEEIRPLVVIDPEDREQVERLTNALLSKVNDSVLPFGLDLAQAALREFANPVVKPEEPTGLAAVVEDADGDRWVRSRIARGGLLHAHWENSRTCAHGAYSDIDAIKVLSDGIPA